MQKLQNQQKPKIYKKIQAKSSTKPLVCWDCGKKGHTRNHCKVKRKINTLPISDDEKQKLIDLLFDDDFEFELLVIEESESSDWMTDSDKDKNLECQCDHCKAIMDLNGLSISKIRAHKLVLLDLITSITDKDQLKKIVEIVLEASKQKKLKPKMEVVVNPLYSMTKVLS